MDERLKLLRVSFSLPRWAEQEMVKIAEERAKITGKRINVSEIYREAVDVYLGTGNDIHEHVRKGVNYE